ncbi:MAG TPA: hypothetical protein VHE30_08305 [Polyangiaceae bacterium]|nr:hypothetical protein [Polyangiaceae bacterium]
MPVVVAPLLGLSLGAAFAWAAASQPSRGAGHGESRAMLVVVLFGVLVFAPAAGFFPAFFPDWSYGYFLEGSRHGVALDLFLVLLAGLSVPGGFALAQTSAAHGRTPAILRMGAIPAALALLGIGLTLPRLRVFATYAEYHGDFGTEPLTGSPVGYALLWMSIVVAGAFAWTFRLLARLGESGPLN